MSREPAGRYRLRELRNGQDFTALRALRALSFPADALQRCDSFDAAARHFVIEASDSGALVGCFRLTAQRGDTLAQSYAAQFYDLGPLRQFEGVMLELGRFCVHPEWQDPDILRLAWGRLAREVDAQNAGLLFGCSSFAGISSERYSDAFGLLQARHLAPARWRPGVKAAEVIPLTTEGQARPDLRRAQETLPPLLRSYLTMGGWVSDHAVIDRDMNTLHVFTGLEIAAIPPGRKRLLRALA